MDDAIEAMEDQLKAHGIVATTVSDGTVFQFTPPVLVKRQVRS